MPANVQSILVRRPINAIGIVGNSAMPDVNCQHLVSVSPLQAAVSCEKADKLIRHINHLEQLRDFRLLKSRGVV